MAGKLVICATPIGNLGDASTRLQSELAAADIIYAEDTRRTAKLLAAFGLRSETRSYFVGNEEHRARELARRLADGAIVALVSDAGMPSLADPGLSAVRAALEVGAEITVVPGPSAVTAALAVSGLPAERFVFEGFLPRKGRERHLRLQQLATEQRTAVLFCSKKRLGRDLSDLGDALSRDRQVVVTRELTKAFEEIWRGTLAEAIDYWEAAEARGEFTVVVAGAPVSSPDLDDAVARTLTAIEAGESMTDAVRRIASETGLGRHDLYEAVLEARR